ncbi:hypothetical protein [Mesorhizobium sp. M00.F.Ca.ET.217.01.1.1]|uniref:hypothetical protein n=1 Tax=Mesorhizobium sp. M00.F.Ca.ET.217.01.1.1 TaxID=2500529 RepID=UPI000FDC4951|nr:hypothetical protein [Mesorhizobium sp. M00.F.Ca.ET.217.01.1.1]TGQ19286.1 hypothetical protein EN860_019330 [Mesorhizobium sp. M00.F.Ca.ET.217.01.1.1]
MAKSKIALAILISVAMALPASAGSFRSFSAPRPSFRVPTIPRVSPTPSSPKPAAPVAVVRPAPVAPRPPVEAVRPAPLPKYTAPTPASAPTVVVRQEPSMFQSMLPWLGLWWVTQHDDAPPPKLDCSDPANADKPECIDAK